MTNKNPALISVHEAATRIADGATLIDVRGADEFAREHIAGALNLPLPLTGARIPDAARQGAIVFHCKTGMRTQNAAAEIGEAARCEAFVMEGGIDAWKRAGLPVAIDRQQPLDIQRQVQIGAGGLMLLGLLLAALLSPWFALLSAGVGAGLVHAGVTGNCGLALLLRHMPWNKRATTLAAA